MTATPTRSTAAVWRPGDPVGDRRFAAIGDLALERGGVLPDVTVAYETWGTLVAVRRQRRARRARPDRRQPRRRRRRAGARVARLVARPDRSRARRSTPTTCSSSRATCSAAARARPGRPPPTPTGVRGAAGSRSSRSATRSRPRSALADALGIRRWHGVLGGSMGGMRVLEWAAGAPRPASSAPWCSPRRPTPRPTRSPGASRSCSPSGPTRPSAAATTTTSDEWPVTGMGIARRIAHTTYRTRPSSTTGSADGPGSARTRSAGGGSLRRRELPRPPRRRSWRAASTRTATSC